jgi:LPS-assembly lipoprotein
MGTIRAFRLFVTAALCLALAACGFHLRGQTALPYESIYVLADAPVSTFATQVKRAVRAGSSSTRITDNPTDAEVTLQVLSELRERSILSLSGGGRIRELQLRYRVMYRVLDKTSKELIGPSEIILKRDLSYNDTDVIAKQQEESLLYRDMQNDAVQQLVRRLQALRA